MTADYAEISRVGKLDKLDTSFQQSLSSKISEIFTILFWNMNN